ncbi:MAG: hypothetical protein E4H03_09620 [Myxococcales bacterium]|nr:MAG: hypothetical protein E4H03_09620 [Myxococcales bacterium]
MYWSNQPAPRRRFLHALCGLASEPRELAVRTFFVFVSIELVLVGMHFVVTDLFASAAAATLDGHIGGFDLDDEATLAVVCLLTAWAHESTDRDSSVVRVWSCAALVLFVIAIDETAGLHEVAGQFLSTAIPFVPIHESLWWSVPYALGVVPMLAYVCLSARSEPRFAAGALLGAGCWFGANTLERILVTERSRNVALEEGLEMFGASILLLTLTFYFLDVAMVEEDLSSADVTLTESEAVATIVSLG